MAITCAGAVASLPSLAVEGWYNLHAYLYPSMPPGMAAPTWTFRRVCEFAQVAVFKTSLASLALVGLIVGIFCMTIFRRGRRMVIITACIFVASLTIDTVLEVGTSFYYVKYPPVSSALIAYFQKLALDSIAILAVYAYPPLLSALVMKKSKPHVSVIWWVTIAACVAMALPILRDWYFEFDKQRDDAIGNMFLVDQERLSPLLAIGSMAGALACFAAMVAVVWTLLHGPKGRAALLICAALLVVRGFCLGASAVFQEVWLAYWRWTSPSATFWDWAVLLPLSRALATGISLIAFGLAIRVALSLSEVRAKLDRLPAPAPA
jgi:hypothetical protein